MKQLREMEIVLERSKEATLQNEKQVEEIKRIYEAQLNEIKQKKNQLEEDLII